MTNDNSKLQEYVIVLLLGKSDSGMTLKSILEKSGYIVHLTYSLYECLKVVNQEMPHLVYTESMYSDGDAGNLYDKLQQQKQFSKIPIFVHVLKKTRQHLEAVASRKFSGFFLGAATPQVIVKKLMEVIDVRCKVSPYLIETEKYDFNKSLNISIEAKILGCSGDQVVSLSKVEIDSSADLVCSPAEKVLSPAIFRRGTNLKKGEEIFNLFPIHKIIGKGRQWVDNLPKFQLEGEEPQKEPIKQVIYYDQSEERFKQFAQILMGYNIELIHAPTLSRSLSLLQLRGDAISCIFLYELLNDSSGIDWKNNYNGLEQKLQLPVIIGTGSLKTKPSGTFNYIRKPFGLGQLVESINAASQRVEKFSSALDHNDVNGTMVKFKAKARVIGLDESGGLLEVKFPIFSGCKLNVEHEFFNQVWNGSTQVSITAVQRVLDKEDTYRMKFVAIEKGVSKGKYHERIVKAIEECEPVEASNESSDKS